MKINDIDSRTIDTMKFVGIVFVVIGHYPGSFFNIMSPYLFHMPLFFFIGGITLKSDKPLKKSLHVSYSIFKYSFITYIIIGITSVIVSKYTNANLGYPFSTGVISTVELAFSKNFHNNPLFLVCWFLVAYCLAYFVSSSILFIISNLTTKIKSITSAIAAILIGATSVLYLSPIYSLTGNQFFNIASQTLYASMFMILGKEFGIKLIRNITPSIALISFSIISFLYLSKSVDVSVISWSKYPSGFILSSGVSLLCIFVSIFISKCSAISTNKNIFIFIGKNSKHIMSYHLCAFVFVDYIFYFFGYWDISKTTAFKHYYLPQLSIVYAAAGLLLPTAVVFLKDLFHAKRRSTDPKVSDVC